MIQGFEHICIYLVINLLFSLISLGLPFPIARNNLTYQKNCRPTNMVLIPSVMPKVILIYLVFILFIILNPKVTFSSPWTVPPKINLFGSWLIVAFSLNVYN
ncbi:NADH-ubiquinone oxidoreductase chain 3 [Apostasia shenzhenica]|uniref:NADH-ubiquinone oxidoreductase chain 3 n=1 Tax=Apostasia shenzhenica TaxID=1088818 RepID=A0A2I0B3L8_9ASPA|nr:NADH-ubiquinone oxidoreductase chain 3 [Apostasia shenzhenica]